MESMTAVKGVESKGMVNKLNRKSSVKDSSKATLKDSSKTTLKDSSKTTLKDSSKTTLKDSSKGNLKEKSESNLKDDPKENTLDNLQDDSSFSLIVDDTDLESKESGSENDSGKLDYAVYPTSSTSSGVLVRWQKALENALAEKAELGNLLWFYERCWRRQHASLRTEDLKDVEDKVPKYITLEAIQEQEKQNNAQGPSTFIKLRAAAVLQDIEEELRNSTRKSTMKERQTLAKEMETLRKSLTTSSFGGARGKKAENPTLYLKQMDKVELLTTEIRIFKQESTTRLDQIEIKKKWLHHRVEEHLAHLRDATVLQMRFATRVKRRGRIAGSAFFDAPLLRKFHRDIVKGNTTTCGILRLTNTNLQTAHARIDDLVQRKQENRDEYTEMDVEALKVVGEKLARENITSDEEIKNLHSRVNDTIFMLRNATNALHDSEKKNNQLQKGLKTKHETVYKHVNEKLSQRTEIEELKAELEELRRLPNTFIRPDTQVYVAVTARNRQRKREIAAMHIKVKIAEMNLKRMQGKEKEAKFRESRGQSRVGGGQVQVNGGKGQSTSRRVTLPPISVRQSKTSS